MIDDQHHLLRETECLLRIAINQENVCPRTLYAVNTLSGCITSNLREQTKASVYRL